MLSVYKLWGKRKPVLGQSKPVIVPIFWVKIESSSFIASANSVNVIKPDAYICKCSIDLLCNASKRFCFCSRFNSMILSFELNPRVSPRALGLLSQYCLFKIRVSGNNEIYQFTRKNCLVQDAGLCQSFA